jgi:hypothetical protein
MIALVFQYKHSLCYKLFNINWIWNSYLKSVTQHVFLKIIPVHCWTENILKCFFLQILTWSLYFRKSMLLYDSDIQLYQVRQNTGWMQINYLSNFNVKDMKYRCWIGAVSDELNWCHVSDELNWCHMSDELIWCCVSNELNWCCVSDELIWCRVGRTDLVPCVRRTELVPCVGRTELVPCVGRTDLVPCVGRTDLVLCVGRTELVLCVRWTELWVKFLVSMLWWSLYKENNVSTQSNIPCIEEDEEDLSNIMCSRWTLKRASTNVCLM